MSSSTIVIQGAAALIRHEGKRPGDQRGGEPLESTSMSSSNHHKASATRARARLSLGDIVALLNPLALYSRRDTVPSDEALLGRGVRFVKRIYRMRMVGVVVGFLCVAAAFVQHPVSWPLWLLLAGHALVWPQVARWWALKSRIPYRAERRNLIIDTVFAGFWVAAMQGNLVPCAVVMAMVSMDNIAAGGLRLFMRGLYAGAAAGLFGWWILDAHYLPQSDITTTLASLPMLLLYPLALGKTTYDMSKKLAERSQAFEQVSQTDGLTGLFNRRYWESLLIEHFATCHRQVGRSHHASCLLLLDLDHFKSINDTHGHLAGDEVLRHFARLLRSNLRQQDAIGRYGGEEFVVILHNTALADARMLAQRVIDQVRQQRLIGDCLRGCTVSIGLVPFSGDMEAHYAWLQRADHAMYCAKEQGRDCLVLWDDALRRRPSAVNAAPV